MKHLQFLVNRCDITRRNLSFDLSPRLRSTSDRVEKRITQDHSIPAQRIRKFRVDHLSSGNIASKPCFRGEKGWKGFVNRSMYRYDAQLSCFTSGKGCIVRAYPLPLSL